MRAGLDLGRRPEDLVVDAVVRDVDAGGVGLDQSHQLVAGRLRRHDAARRSLHRRPNGGAVERAARRRVEVGLAEEGGVVNRRDDRPTRTHRHRVVRRVDHRGADVLGDQRQAGLLPGDARGAVRQRRRAGHDLGAGHQPAVALGIDALADDREIGVARGQRSQQTVDVAPKAAPVGRNSSGVDEHPRRQRDVHLDCVVGSYVGASAYAANHRLGGVAAELRKGRAGTDVDRVRAHLMRCPGRPAAWC